MDKFNVCPVDSTNSLRESCDSHTDAWCSCETAGSCKSNCSRFSGHWAPISRQSSLARVVSQDNITRDAVVLLRYHHNKHLMTCPQVLYWPVSYSSVLLEWQLYWENWNVHSYHFKGHQGSLVPWGGSGGWKQLSRALFKIWISDKWTSLGRMLVAIVRHWLELTNICLFLSHVGKKKFN